MRIILKRIGICLLIAALCRAAAALEEGLVPVTEGRGIAKCVFDLTEIGDTETDNP